MVARFQSGQLFTLVTFSLLGCGEESSKADSGSSAMSVGGNAGASAGGAVGGLGASGGAAGEGGSGEGAGSFVLSPDNLTGQDEDPAVLREQDGAISVAWYSNRNGLGPDGREDKEIFLVRTTDGDTWSAPLQLTSHPTEWSFYPSLAQSQDGAVHLAWWLMTLTPPGCTPSVDCTGNSNTLMYATSPDWESWNLEAAEAITTGPGDWLPSILYDSVGDRLLVYFAAVARNAQSVVTPGDAVLRIFAVSRDAGGWSEPFSLSGNVNATGTHNTFPYVVQRADGSFVMTWTRYDGSGGSGVLDVLSQPSSQTMLATSSNGATWSDPIALSGEGLNVFPQLYADHAGVWLATWLTTAFSPDGDQVEMVLGGTIPDDLAMRLEIAGYTAKLVASATPGVFFGASVIGSNPNQKIEGAFFRK
jgi:hypothetical protein